MDDQQWLTERFQQHRPHLRAVAYRMLGSLTDADDAVQDAWERVSRARAEEVGNLKAWLTTIVARVCLNLLRSRNAQREESLEVSVPDPILTLEGGPDPEQQVLLAEGVGLALQVVIDTLAPAERLAFVLHDLFDLPFEEIAPMVGRTPEATRQLASRARRRVKGAEPPAPVRGDPWRSRRRPPSPPGRTPRRTGPPGPGQRCRRRRPHDGRAALRRVRLHHRPGQDRPDRRSRRPRPRGKARRARPRQRVTLPLSMAVHLGRSRRQGPAPVRPGCAPVASSTAPTVRRGSGSDG